MFRTAFIVSMFWVAIASADGQDVDDAGQPGTMLQPTTAPLPLDAQWRLPVSYREHSKGLEVACLHDPLPPARLLPMQPGVSEGRFEVGDIISHVNGRAVQRIDDLFIELGARGSAIQLTVINVRDGQPALWNIRPASVRVPVGQPKPDANGEGRIIAIHVVDSNANRIGANITKNVNAMKDLFQRHIASKYLREYITLSGNNCSAGRVLETLARIQVDRQDTLILFYQGHGAYAQQFAQEDPAGGHFLDFSSDDLLRRDLLRAMHAKGARLTVLISDACNVRSTVDIVPRREYAAKMLEVTGWTALEELLLCHRGTLDLTSASRGQYAWSSSDIGGWFTNAFITGMISGAEDKNRSWSKLWQSVKVRTEATFRDRRQQYGLQFPQLRRQKTMVPQEFIWDLERDDPPNAPQGTRMFIH